jgi:hypothetical protein
MILIGCRRWSLVNGRSSSAGERGRRSGDRYFDTGVDGVDAEGADDLCVGGWSVAIGVFAMCFETGFARLKAHRRLVWCNSILNFSARAYSSHDGIRVSALG